MGKAQDLQRLEQRQQLVGIEPDAVGEVRQVGAAVIGRLGQRVDEAAQLLHRRIGQAVGDADRLQLDAALAAFAARRGREQA